MSSAGGAHITNNVELDFFDSTTASSAAITNAANGTITFNNNASAGTATIDNSGSIQFNNSSTGSGATITIESGANVKFFNTSTGGPLRFINDAGGSFDISNLTSTGASAGSIEGAGNFILGSKSLTVGGNNLSTAVSGVISDGGAGGSLIMTGSGTLTLSGANTYTGATTINSGATIALSGSGVISDSSVITANGTFDIPGATASFVLIKTLAGAGSVSLGGKSLVITAGSTDFSGVISDGGNNGGIEIAAGTQTLSGVNTYTNVTQIDSGATLALKGSGSIANSLYVGFTPGSTATLDISQTSAGASVSGLFDSTGVGVVSLGSKTLTIGSAGTFFNGIVQDGGIGGGTGGGLTIAVGGDQQLGGVNTYTGLTTINSSSELDLIANGLTDGSIATSSGVVDNGVFDISDLGQHGTTPVNASIKSLSGTDAGAFVFLGENQLTLTNAAGSFAGAISDGGFSGGAGGKLVLASGMETLTGANTYSGGTTISAGTLQLGSGGASGSIIGDVLDNGAFVIDRSNTYTFGGAITGSGSFQQTGPGTTILTGPTSYSGVTSVAAGTLQAGATNVFSASSDFTVASGATLALNNFNQTIASLAGAGMVTLGSATLTTGGDNAATTFSGSITGAGGLVKTGGGTFTLSGTSNNYTGPTKVIGGVLNVTGSLGNTAVTVQSGTTLEGTGSIAGPVTILSGGTLMPGDAPGTITVGPLTLNAGSILSYQLGTADVVGGATNDLTIVNGSLTINGGTLNVTNAGSFGPGLYQIVDYSGALGGTGNLAVGTLPAGNTGVIQTAIPGQINLVVSNGSALTQFWDGATPAGDGTIHGGSGTWDSTRTNWTTPNGTINASWQSGVAVFAGTAGTVTVAAPIAYQGLQFLTSGYTLTATGGGTLTPNGMAPITVASGQIATISAPIVGFGGVLVNGAGTLILSGFNNYIGGTQISAGTLQVSQAASLGPGTVTLDGGTFQVGATGLIIGNPFAINATGGTIDTQANMLTLSNSIADGAGSGALTKVGAGTLTLTGANTYTGGTTIAAGALQLGTALTPGSIVGAVTVDANAAFNVTNATIPGVTTVLNNGFIQVSNASTLGSAAITDNLGIELVDSASAGGATINNTNVNSLLRFFNTSTAGGATISNNGFVQFSDQSTAGGANITNNQGLNFFNSSTAGNASITNGINGDVEFENSSSAGSATVTNNGNWAFLDTSSAGNANIANGQSAGLSFFAASTASNAAIVNNGFISFGTTGGADTATAGSATITNNSGAETDFNAFSTAGSATIVTNNGGVTAFFDNSTGGQATFITNAGGVVDFSATAGPNNDGKITAASISGAGSYFLGSTILTVGSGNLSMAVSGVISDCGPTGQDCFESTTGGALVKAGTGMLTLTGANTYTGGTTINAGVLQIGNGGTTGSIFGNVADNATLVFDRSDAVAFGGVISGSGAVQQIGFGSVTLSGANTYTGGTTLDVGTLIIGNNSALGTGALSMAAGTTLSFLSTGNFTISNLIEISGDPNFAPPAGTTQILSGVIADGASPGTLAMTGAGTLVLSATETYTGPTTVASGTLDVTGSIVSSSLTTVGSGATLTGSGTIGALTIGSGGVFAPGAGTARASTSVFGALSFNAGATYQTQVSPAAAAFAKVTGPASLAGTVSAVFGSGAYVTKQYTILTATAGLGGTTFATLANISPPAGFTDSLSFDAVDVYLNLKANAGAISTVGLNVNQRNVANALNGVFNATGSLPPAFTAGISGANSAGAALSQLSGEGAVGAEQGAFQFTNSFLSLMLDPYTENRGGFGGTSGFGTALGYAEGSQTPSAISSAFSALVKDKPGLVYQPGWTVWGAGFGGGAQVSGNAAIGSHNTSSGTGGGVVGADYHVTPDAMLGFAVAYGGMNWSTSGFGGGRSDVFQAGLYAADEFGPVYVAGALSFGDYWVTTNRSVTLPGGDVFSANFNAQGFGARGETGYHIALAPLTLTPYAALQAQNFHTPSYSESAASGATAFALNYASQSASDTRTEFGAWVDKMIAYPDGNALKLFARAAWAHDWQSNPALQTTFIGLPTASFIVNGAKEAPDRALIAARPNGASPRIGPPWLSSRANSAMERKSTPRQGASAIPGKD